MLLLLDEKTGQAGENLKKRCDLSESGERSV